MPNTRDIRRRIKSVKNTAQITKAMEMVAASKMRRAQQMATSGRPYALLLNKVLVSLRGHTEKLLHPLLEEREGEKHLILVITSDKGLCGALNTNILREVVSLNKEDSLFVALGKKGASFLVRTERELLAEFSLPDYPTFLQTKPISSFCLEQFLEGKVDRVSVLYPQFVNTLVQKPILIDLLPIIPDKVVARAVDIVDYLHHKEKELEVELVNPDQDLPEEKLPEDSLGEYIFEPSPTEVLGSLLPYYIRFEMYQKILDARASEQSARMVAMKAATDNAKKLVKDLTLEYNRARQAAITTEILEIATAQLVLS